MSWESYKKSFNEWENATAQFLEVVLKNPLILEPAGAWLSTAMRAKRLGDRWRDGIWSAMGLPTKRDQERTLHALNQIQSKLFDLEEKLKASESLSQPNKTAEK